MSAKIMEFPFGRVRLDVQSHQAVILKMPVKECPIAMLPAVMALEWLRIWMD